MSFTTNGNMHRHSRIHSKEENLKSLGAQLQMRRGKAAWRQRVSNFLQQQQKLSSPPMTPKSVQDGMHKDVLKNLNLPNHSQQHSVYDGPTGESLIPPVTGVKRQLMTTAADWPSPVKRPWLETSTTDSARKPSIIKTEPLDTDNQSQVCKHSRISHQKAIIYAAIRIVENILGGRNCVTRNIFYC